MKFYMDVFFGINFVMDLFILWMEGKILCLPGRTGRLIAGAFVSAAISCAAVWLTKGVFAGNTKGVWLIAALLGQAASAGIGYGFDGFRPVLRRMGLLWALGFLSAGCFVWVYSYTGFGAFITGRLPDGLKPGSIVLGGIVFTAGAAVAYAGAKRLSGAGLSLLGLSGDEKSLVRSRIKPNCLEAELVFQGRKIRTIGLVDTGNGLLDPISRAPVVIADRELVKEWLALAAQEHQERFRVIPYHSIGVEHGMLEAVMLDEIVLFRAEGTVRGNRVICAAAAGAVSVTGEYHVILHPSIIRDAKAAG